MRRPSYTDFSRLQYCETVFIGRRSRSACDPYQHSLKLPPFCGPAFVNLHFCQMQISLRLP